MLIWCTPFCLNITTLFPKYCNFFSVILFGVILWYFLQILGLCSQNIANYLSYQILWLFTVKYCGFLLNRPCIKTLSYYRGRFNGANYFCLFALDCFFCSFFHATWSSAKVCLPFGLPFERNVISSNKTHNTQ